MNQQQIIKDLGFDAKYWLAKKYAAKLQSLFTLINELEKMDGCKVELKGIKGNAELVKELSEIKRINYKYDSQYNEAVKQQNYCRCVYGEFEQWQQVEISHNSGCYKFPFPINNRLYNVIAGMAGQPVNETKKEVVIIKTTMVDSAILKYFDKAAKFISKDDLRPVMQQVCIAFENYQCEVVGTDAHRLFLSPKFGSSEKDSTKLLVSEKAAKTIAKMKPETDLCEIHLLADNKIQIEGQIFDLFTDRYYVDYRCVMPDYKKYMEFDRQRLIDNVNKVKVYANKCTQQVTFHLNGSISLHSQDVDFSFEGDADMPYITKQFPDTDIAFNGKFLNECLAVFKNKTVKMFTDGSSNKGVLLTNDVDTVLLMPLLINS